MPIPKTQVAEAIWNLLDKSSNSKKTAKSVANYMVAERRTKDLPSILRLVEEHQLSVKDILEVTATTASPLSSSSKNAISDLFDAKNVLIHEEINPNVIAGVRVRALDKVADFSVQARLRQLRARSK